jgi:hypothetical protein
MQAASRPYALAAAVLAATSAVVAIPLASRPVPLPIRSMETRLVDADSVLNIPINLFDDFMNIPYNEIEGLNVLSDSMLFSGDWWVPNATNLWGTDPGDIGHYMGLIDEIIPFSAISGLGQPEIDPTLDASGMAGLGQQLGLLAAAELPTNASCDAQTCAPVVPPNQITGITDLDRLIGFFESITGHAPSGASQIFENWLTVPLSDLTSGYTFTTADDPGLVDPSPDTGPGGAVLSGLGFDGTISSDGQNLMPWAGDTFKLNLFGPLEAFYNSLLATPSTDGIAGATGTAIPGTGIELPTLTEITQSFQAFAASLLVAFDPLVEGSPVCAATCDISPSLTLPALLQDLDPGDSNPIINEYLAGLAAGTDSAATQSEVDASIALLQTGILNLSPTELATVDSDLAAINPELPTLLTNAGILTDPGYLAYADALEANQSATPVFDPVYGGYDPSLVLPDLLKLLGDNAAAADVPSGLSNLVGLFDPMTYLDVGNLLAQMIGL